MPKVVSNGGLTGKMMKFCEEYIRNGGNATEAYIFAYDTKSRSNAGVEGYRLMSDERIKKYLEELRKPIKEAVTLKAVSDRQRKIKLIEDRIDHCIEKDDDNAIARYIDIWNKMDGEYVNYSKDLTPQNEMITNMDMDMLEKLAHGTIAN